jgi:hypothetical protein
MTKENEKKHLADVSLYAEWKVVPSRYLHVIGLYIGRFKVASYCMDGINSKSDPKAWSVSSNISNIKLNNYRFEKEQECRDKCLEIANMFISALNS